ncbi:Uncharacterised protein [Klebsiella pneumoniae]|nr:Uncharacterised protein [Klebsiella pneumoniae]
MILRIAVHFCPAFAVISRTTSRINSANSGCSGVTSSPNTQQLSESASMVKGIDLATRLGCVRSCWPVAAEPVKVTTSWLSRWSSRSPAPPQIRLMAPSGTRPLSTIAFTIAWVSWAVAVAGLMIAGMPASQVGASFSSIPQQGKLKALIWTATPDFDVST